MQPARARCAPPAKPHHLDHRDDDAGIDHDGEDADADKQSGRHHRLEPAFQGRRVEVPGRHEGEVQHEHQDQDAAEHREGDAGDEQARPGLRRSGSCGYAGGP